MKDIIHMDIFAVNQRLLGSAFLSHSLLYYKIAAEAGLYLVVFINEADHRFILVLTNSRVSRARFNFSHLGVVARASVVGQIIALACF